MQELPRVSNVIKTIEDIAFQTNILALNAAIEAAEQQAEAVKQVTVGIERISQVIGTNSATAAQSAAFCEEL